jgi:phage gpG-like protein
LQDRGRLKGSFRLSSGLDWAEIRTQTQYAATHNFGDSKRRIPARPFIRDLSDPAKNKIIRLLERHFWR